MDPNEILRDVKESIRVNNWLTATNIKFRDVYYKSSMDVIPFELLLNGENIIVQIRRKFFFVFDTIAEFIADQIQKENNLSTKPQISTVIDADSEYSTRVFLIWNDYDLVLSKYYSPAINFYFKNEAEMKSFLLTKYSEGITKAKFYLQN